VIQRFGASITWRASCPADGCCHRFCEAECEPAWDEDMLGSILSLRRRAARTFNPPPRAVREEERTPGKNLHDLRPALYLAQKMGALLG
jgi:hypothetical protein